MTNQNHDEVHFVERTGWLRAAVLGANDGLISTASLMVGVAASSAGTAQILLAGIAGLGAGAMSMAAGEYVSVSSQADSERADLKREARALKDHPEAELEELTMIYVDRGVSPATAREVAEQLTANDALAAHSRDELGLSDAMSANPLQAAVASALAFGAGAAIPLVVAVFSPPTAIVYAVSAVTLVFLAVLGALGAIAGGAPVARAAVRVVFWGAIAMAMTGLIGRLAGTVV